MVTNVSFSVKKNFLLFFEKKYSSISTEELRKLLLIGKIFWRKLRESIKTVKGNLFELDYAENSFDLIWF